MFDAAFQLHTLTTKSRTTSFRIKVTRSLGLVSFEQVQLVCMSNIKSLFFMVQSYGKAKSFFATRVTD